MGRPSGEHDPFEAASGADRERRVAAALPDCVALLDRERRCLWVNRAPPGLAIELGARLDDVLPPLARAEAIAAIDRAFTTGEATELELELEFERETRRHRTRICPCSRAGEAPTALLVMADVTAERRAEEAIRAGEARFRSFLDRIPDYVLELDDQRRILYTNRYHPNGTGPDQVLGVPIEELAVPEKRAEVRELLEHLFATGQDVAWLSGSTVDPGQYRVRARLLPGPPARALVVATDGAEQRAIAERLDVSEQRLERAIAGGNLAVWERDLDAGVTTANGPLAEDLGIGLTDASWLERVHPDDHARAVEALAQALRGEDTVFEVELRARSRSTGQWRSVLSRARRMQRTHGGPVLVGTTTDITALREAEAARRELDRKLETAQRLESVGLLAGGVAHDFNNLMAVILLTADAAQRSPDPAGISCALADITAAASRAAELTKQLLAFSRRLDVAKESVDVVGLVDDTLALARRTLSSRVEVRVVRPDAPAFVLGDRGQLEQVLMNLCLNARDAMPRGGVLSLRTEIDTDVVRITVADTGTGIEANHLDHIFEPFFTTKPRAQGSGLGLAVAHGIVQQHEGEIRVHSDLGVGTEMVVVLPRVMTSPSPAAPEVEATTGHGTILLAEDEPSLRRVAERLLTQAGYRVVAVEDGLDAVVAFERAPHEFDLVLLDVMMPRLDGVRASERIRGLRADVPILFSTGYSAGSVDGPMAAGMRVLPKPYRAAQLLEAVRAAMGQRAARVE